jgi:transcriptional regulator with XRE-family HTH domain
MARLLGQHGLVAPLAVHAALDLDAHDGNLPLWSWSCWLGSRTIRRVDPSVQRFGQNVPAARLARGWTQEDLSSASGLAVVQVSRVERGVREIRLTTLLRLLTALELRPDELLARTLVGPVGLRTQRTGPWRTRGTYRRSSGTQPALPRRCVRQGRSGARRGSLGRPRT